MSGMKRLLFAACVILILMTFCVSNPRDMATLIPVGPTDSFVTTSPAKTSRPTLTPESVPTRIPSAEPLPIIKIQCVNDVGSSQGLELPGIVVLQQPLPKIDYQKADETRQWPDIRNGFYLLKPSNGQIVRSIEDGLQEQVSPDGKYLTYLYDNFFVDTYQLDSKTILGLTQDA